MTAPPVPPVRLYCFPYAGATSAIYRPWREAAHPGLTVVGVDQPGRGTRRAQPRIADFPALVEDLARVVAADLAAARDGHPPPPYATFGHSFGGPVSLAAAAAVTRLVGHPPVRSVLSASLPPGLHRADEVPPDDAELLARMRADGATAPGLLDDGAMAGYLVRLMREDYAIRAQFAAHRPPPVPFPLSMIAARDDLHVTHEQMKRWSEHSTAPSDLVEIPGGHFAAFRDPAATLALVHAEIHPTADRTAGDTGDRLTAGR